MRYWLSRFWRAARRLVAGARAATPSPPSPPSPTPPLRPGQRLDYRPKTREVWIPDLGWIPESQVYQLPRLPQSPERFPDPRFLQNQHRRHRWSQFWDQICRLPWTGNPLPPGSSTPPTPPAGTQIGTGAETPGTTTISDWLRRTQPPSASPSATGDGNSDFL